VQHRRRLTITHANAVAASGFAQEMIALTDQQQGLRRTTASTATSAIAPLVRFYGKCNGGIKSAMPLPKRQMVMAQSGLRH
jgi:hypothetical protein